MRYAVQASLDARTWLLEYTKADSREAAAQLLDDAIIARRALIHPRTKLEIVRLDEPPTNEDR